MRHVLMSLLLLGLLAGKAWTADDAATKTPKQSEAFKKLKDEYEGVQKKQAAEQTEIRTAAIKAMQAAKTDEEREQIQKKAMAQMTDNVGPKFSPRFLEFAQDNPKDPSAFDALALALQTSGGPDVKGSNWPKVISALKGGYVMKPEVKKVVRQIANAGDEGGNKLIHEIIARNPDRKIQANAAKALAKSSEQMAAFANQLKDNDTLKKRVEDQAGKEFVIKLLANADKTKKEAEELNKLLKDKYADVMPDLSVGKPAPQIVLQDLDGKAAKLSDLKGKVVVLDIWATWCGPCRQMIPHSREMVSKLKDKPFALVSISADEEKQTLVDFLAKEKMPWTHWWSGTESAMMEDYEIEHFPTIYVLDGKGIIRHKELRGEELEKAVEKLLEEMGEKKSGE